MKNNSAIAVMLIMAAGALGSLLAMADETNNLVVTAFQNGYVTWTNVNSNLYYTVECKPNLPGTNTPWDGSYRALQDVKSSQAVLTAPVGVYYRVVGSTNPMHSMAVTPKTGQTGAYQAGDDGANSKGAVWPNPRFTVGTGVDGTNCVTDNLTGLTWARNANLAGQMTWSDAIAYCAGLTYGGTNDWRLPNVREMHSLIDYGQSSPALCNASGVAQWTENDPFTDVQSGSYYWSSTSVAFKFNTDYAWFIYLSDGYVEPNEKINIWYVWPVSGGK